MALLVFMCLFSSKAGAQTSAPDTLFPGCDPTAWEALASRGQAYSLREIAWEREMMPQPESALVTTSYPQAAQISEERGQKIFSGDFADGLERVIGDSTSTMLSNSIYSFLWELPSVESVLTSLLTSALDFLGLGPEPDYDFNMIKTLVDQQTMNGVDSYVSYFTYDELMSGSPPGLGDVGLENISNGSATLANVLAKEDALKAARQGYAPIFTSPETVEEVMGQAGY